MTIVVIGLLLIRDRSTVAQQADAQDEQCIRCHVEIYNDALRQQVIHPPVFERQCSICHRAGDAEWSAQSESLPQTGLLVDQQPLWRKRQSFAGDISGYDHLVTLAGLQPSALYRFRLQLGEQPGEPFAASSWLGLRLAELTEYPEMLVTDGLSGVVGANIAALKIQLVSADTAVVSWQTAQPYYSWLELELLEEAEVIEASAEDGQQTHPPLRSPEEQAITVCYQCHSEADLGTSHPVRLYSGRDVRIPETLPTVEGMLTCVTCHDPHGGPGEMLVRTQIKTQLCVTCHYKYKNSSPSTMFRD
ncbi:doubled CXXCH domain-containing protein [Malonomonas rubra DSM 5091]|uniref:Doubled CXXCH domain-containing protein n=2 Tax=Malonomonas rubra TaxID=57040 RepID=A0A1M6HYU1_MALRU|nr:doubled CXXCH domain-containing protein [Malonomonas rubra DSM 5091]